MEKNNKSNLDFHDYKLKGGCLRLIRVVDNEKSMICFNNLTTGKYTPWLGEKKGLGYSFQTVNDSYVLYFCKNSNIIYKSSPESQEIQETYEFEGKVMDAKQQGTGDVFIVSLNVKNKVKYVLFDANKFTVVSESFNSLSFDDEDLRPDQRRFTKDDEEGNLIEGIINLKGEIEKSSVISGIDVDPVIMTGKGGEVLFDIDSCRIISTIFRSIYGRVNALGKHYENEPRFFTKVVNVNGKDIVLKGIVNSYGQIAPFVLNTLSKELISLPLFKENGVDHIDDVSLRGNISSNERSTAPNEEDLLVKINREFLNRKFCKVGIEGYPVELFQYDKIICDTESVRLNYDLRVSNNTVIGIRLNTYVSTDENCFYRDVFRKPLKSPMNLTKNQPADPLYSFDTLIDTGCGVSLETSGKIDSHGILRGGCILNVYSDEYSNNYNGLKTTSFREISRLHSTAIYETVNCELFGLQVTDKVTLQNRKVKEF